MQLKWLRYWCARLNWGSSPSPKAEPSEVYQQCLQSVDALKRGDHWLITAPTAGGLGVSADREVSSCRLR